MKRFLPVAFFFSTIAASFAQLAGIDYNFGTQHNQFLCINPGTGAITVANCFDFDSGYWLADSFTTDVSSGKAYAVSSAGTLYTFSLTSGIIQQTNPLGISLIRLGLGGTLAGIRQLSSGFEFHSIDPTTGGSTTLSSFTMPGYYPATFVTDLVNGPAGSQGTAYILATDYKLYTFNVTTGALLGTPQLSTTVTGIDVGTNGNLIGLLSVPAMSYQWELHSIDPVTGNNAMLSSFNTAPNGIYVSTFKSNPSTNTVHVASPNGFGQAILYSFDLSNGSPITTSTLAMPPQTIAIGAPGPCSVSPACCAPGNLDTTFSPGPFMDSAVAAVVVEPSGKILIGGSFDSYNGNSAATGIARLDPNGSVDNTFNPGGTGTDGIVREVVLQPDGKILIGGAFAHYNGQPRNGIARLHPDGALDTGFIPATGANEDVSAIRLQSNGDILVGGVFISGSSPGLARLHGATGALDVTFNSGAVTVNARVDSIAVQSDGKIIIGGDFTAYNATPRDRVARLNADGSLDGTFTPTTTGANNLVFEVALEPGPPPNKVIIGGAFSDYDGGTRYRLARLLPNGTLDTGFDANAVTTANPASAVHAISVLSDGNVLIGGNNFSNSGTRVARLLPSGALDPSFDPAPGTGADDVVLDIAVQPDGKVLIGGEFTSYSGASINRVARLCATTPPAALMRLLNISTRAKVGPGDAAIIGGFIITGTTPVRIIARGIGPSLAAANVQGALQDPTLELYQGSSFLGSNDDWRETLQNEADVLATTIPPSDNRESALVRTLNPGDYTAIVRGKNATTGLGLVEVYDLNQPPASELANISARGDVQTQDGVMFGGFILSGTETTGVVVRALGPSLAAFNVNNPLADPTLELFNSNGMSLGSNDNWALDPNASQVILRNLAPANPLESAIAITLPPGAYTAIVAGKLGATGIGLVEVYHTR
ncbi:MAG TPA: delta-60 repeat domain-containing protein [Chthoniobacterales bacterium]|nr:delta-60 repeat domain-containing protein [Chthoniobacterales bacterium]